jgi:fatty acid desaturase
MTTKEIIIAFTIHLIIPLVGLLLFLKLKHKMKRENIENPPTIEFFVIFATYGGLLLVALTTLFWQWSGMASLGLFYLIIGAPIAMGFIAYKQRQKKTISKFHSCTYNSGLLYFIISPLTIFILFLIRRN